ncbi:hypothetical protein ACIBUY_30465 [Streptomyces sp. NPDC050085]|uniref:hypothetical protein n=1 Tax=Streptomyces sp. NPDC050085 TaxID=3365600 RepID=UPI0037A9DF00
MAWDEWEQIKAQHAPARMQLNHLPDGEGPAALPSTTGDLKVKNEELTDIGRKAHTLYDSLWSKARTPIESSDSAATDLTSQGFALGAALQTVSNRWDQQLKSLMDACAQISNHLQVTKKVHAGDEHYIQRQMSSIDTLEEGFSK